MFFSSLPAAVSSVNRAVEGDVSIARVRGLKENEKEKKRKGEEKYGEVKEERAHLEEVLFLISFSYENRELFVSRAPRRPCAM